MYCPRLDHFVRFNPNGTVSRCGHMVAPAQFDSLEQMESSVWLRKIKEKFDQDIWPYECQRCEETEAENGTSIRLNAIEFDQQQTQSDYLTVGGVLDNVCNSACLTCNEDHSTKIGSLISKQYKIVDNTNRFWELPQDRIVHLDLNGGEPSYSKNYKQVLANLPKNVQSVRLNTNCGTVLNELLALVERGIKVTVTVSLDGIGPVHDLVRWPIKWDKFYKNLMIYKSMPVNLNLWTTVSVLNVDDLPNIIAFAQEHNIDHSYAYLKQPAELDVKNLGTPESIAYVQKQKQLRGIV
jgi:sulfatase maturation enzyme AslB (radical SAM superfamily)